ncbi:MAG: GNAT family protein [Bacteroidales bacterium]|nr:GNAT family protein [Bacteroidales bacterium]
MELKLRAVELSDADLFYEWENDISLWEIGNTMRPFSRYALENYVLTSQNEPLQSVGQMRLMIDVCCEAMIATIGCVDVYDFDSRDSKAAVGIFINGTDRGKGYAKKAVAMLCDYISRIYNLNQLYAYVASDNLESKKLFASCGFVHTATLKEWICRKNEFKDVELYQKIMKD